MVKGKKAQLTQIVVFLVAIFVIGTTIILGKLVLDNFYTALDEQDLNTAEMTEAQTNIEAQYATFDYALVLFAVVLIIGMIITSFLIPSHPIFFVINVIGIFILVFIGMVLTNVYGELVAGENEILSDQADEFDLVNFLISKLPYIGAVVVFILSIVMFAKGYGGQPY